MSLIMGGGAGIALFVLGILQLRAWKAGNSSVPLTAASSGARGALTPPKP